MSVHPRSFGRAVVALLVVAMAVVACADESIPAVDGGSAAATESIAPSSIAPPPATPLTTPLATPRTTSDAALPSTTTPPGSTPDTQQEPEGFTTVRARITDADGEGCEFCLWLADTPEERGRGLMGVTHLGDAAGMLFRFDDPVTNPFFMLNTPTPLSIAWFSPGGDFAVATDMQPCVEVPAGGCPLYQPGVEYDLAIEVFEGNLAALGIGPGSRVDLVEGSEAERCPAAP